MSARTRRGGTSRHAVKGLAALLLTVSGALVGMTAVSATASATSSSGGAATSHAAGGSWGMARRYTPPAPAARQPGHVRHAGAPGSAPSALPASPSLGTPVTLYVRTGGQATSGCTGSATTAACGTVQEGVDAADALARRVAVTLTVGPGTYTEHDIEVTVRALFSLTIVGRTGAGATTIDGQTAGSVFLVTTGPVTIDGLSIVNGTASDGYGGGIDTYGGTRATITLEHDVFSTDHASQYSGAVNVTNKGHAKFADDAFSHDSAAAGGAIASLGGTLSVTGSTFSTGTARAGGGVFNGGFTSVVTITSSTFSHDTAATGGGGVFNTSIVKFSGSTFSTDSAPFGGGLFTGTTFAPTATVTGSTFSHDSANSGGAIFQAEAGQATLSAANDTFSHDTATTWGGAVLNGNTSSAALTSVTFSTDAAGADGGAVFSAFGATAKVSASVFDASSCGTKTSGTLSGVYDVMTTTTTCARYLSTITGVTTTTSAIKLTTTLKPNTTTGTYTTAPQTLALLSGSPAIGEVPSAVCTQVTSDERGAGRPGTGCDAGAFELDFQVVLYVRTGGTGVTCTVPTYESTPTTLGVVLPNPCGQIAWAVHVAEAIYGPSTAVTITVGPGTYTEHTITVTAPTLASLTIVGKTGAATTVVDGTTSGSVFLLGRGRAGHLNAAIDGVTITHGTAHTTGHSDTTGGGIDTYGDLSLTLENDVFTTNHATHAGGVNVTYGVSATFVNDTFTHDSAATGGGIENFGGTVTLTRVTFSTDSATKHGGGLASIDIAPGARRASSAGHSGRPAGWDASVASGQAARVSSVPFAGAGTATATLTTVTFTGSSASTGGGIANSAGDLTLTDVGFSDDGASTGGGGITDYRGKLSLTQVDFTTDHATSFGGGLDAYTTAATTLTRVTFTHDTTGSTAAGHGGGIDSGTGSTLSVVDAVFTNGDARTGGGIANDDGSTAGLTGVSFATNHASRYGGALDSFVTATATLSTVTSSHDSSKTEGGGIVSYGRLNVTRATFATDHSTEAGAIDVTGGTTTVTNVTFSGDSATGVPATAGGGAIENDGALKVHFATFSNDTSTRGGAFYSDGGGATATIDASIFSGSSCVVTTGALSGSYDVVTTTSTGCTGFTHSVTGVRAKNLALTPTPEANTTTGRYTAGLPTLSIGRTSPAVNEVPKTICTTATGDERGAKRPGDSPKTAHTTSCDAGAYELQFTSSATTTHPGGTTTPATPTTQVYGTTADGTAAAEFTRAFPSRSNSCPASRVAVVATTSTFQDALSSQYLAQHFATGTLLTPTTALSTATRVALEDEGISTVYIMGGTLAISATVASAIGQLPAYQCGGTNPSGTISVHRIFGQTQYGTAEAIAEFVGTGSSLSFPGAYAGTNATGGNGAYNDTPGNGSGAPSGSVPTAIVADGTEFQDAQAASVISYRTKLPLLLTPATSLSTTAVGAIQRLGIRQVVLMGGSLAITNAVEQALVAKTGVTVLRVAGKDYTDTATQLADFEAAPPASGLGWTPGHRIMVTRGNGYTDGIAGAVLDSPHNTATGPPGTARPLLLTESPTTVGTHLTTFLKLAGRVGLDRTHAKSISALTILGGPLAVSRPVISAIQGDLAS